jgi:hypothetical protein
LEPMLHTSDTAGPFDVARGSNPVPTAPGRKYILFAILTIAAVVVLAYVATVNRSGHVEPAQVTTRKQPEGEGVPQSNMAEPRIKLPSETKQLSETVVGAERQDATGAAGRISQSGEHKQLPLLAVVYSSSAQDHEGMLGLLRDAGIQIASESATPAASSFTKGPTVMYTSADDEPLARSLAAQLTKDTERKFVVMRRPNGPGPNLVPGKVAVYNF